MAVHHAVHRTVEHLRTRPHHERRAVALLTSFGVVIILFAAWSFFFFRSIRAQSSALPAQTSELNALVQNDGVPTTTSQTQASASAQSAYQNAYFVPTNAQSQESIDANTANNQ